MAVGQKVPSLQKPVAGKNGLVPRAWPPDGGIIADSRNERIFGRTSGRRSAGGAMDALNDGLLYVRCAVF